MYPAPTSQIKPFKLNPDSTGHSPCHPNKNQKEGESIFSGSFYSKGKRIPRMALENAGYRNQEKKKGERKYEAPQKQ